MGLLTSIFTWIYRCLLHLYPRQYQDQFGIEMEAVFADSLQFSSGAQAAGLFLRELHDLPGALSTAYSAAFLEGGEMSTQNDFISPSTKMQALVGTLPFLAFGIASMISKVDQNLPIRGHNVEMWVYSLALFGFLVGWIRGFPLWSYSYLGWSLVFAWWWTNMRVDGFDWGYRVWIPFAITVVAALIWTRSLAPIKKLFQDFWNDWTRLTLAMFAFAGFMGLIYDENHHPQLFWFMLASTLVISAGTWFFLRSSSLKSRVQSIVGSCGAAMVISSICSATWDFYAFHGLSEPTQNWYQSLGQLMMILTFWIALLFWPVLIVLIHRIVKRRTI